MRTRITSLLAATAFALVLSHAAQAQTALTGCTGLSAIPPTSSVISTGALEPAGTSLNRGFIKIEMQANPIGTASTTKWQMKNVK